MVKIPGVEIESDTREYGTLNLSKLPDAKDEMLLQAVANTFLENLNVVYLTIQVNGETVAENLSMIDAGEINIGFRLSHKNRGCHKIQITQYTDESSVGLPCHILHITVVL